jgi:hypothetical protein
MVFPDDHQQEYVGLPEEGDLDLSPDDEEEEEEETGVGDKEEEDPYEYDDEFPQECGGNDSTGPNSLDDDLILEGKQLQDKRDDATDDLGV